jgi:hypothetical protein
MLCLLMPAALSLALMSGCEKRIEYVLSQDEDRANAKKTLEIYSESDSVSMTCEASGLPWFWMTVSIKLQNTSRSSLEFDPWLYELAIEESSGLRPENVVNKSGALFEPLTRGPIVVGPKESVEVSIGFQPDGTFENVEAGQAVTLSASNVLRREGGGEIDLPEIYVFYPSSYRKAR